MLEECGRTLAASPLFATGVVGASAILLGGMVIVVCLAAAYLAYALQVLPVNYAGLALMALGVALMIAEIFAPSFGVLGIGGVIAFAAGSVMLFREEAGEITEMLTRRFREAGIAFVV